jgi:hypothetical protein
MTSRYVDVFISHKSDDAEKVKRLKQRIMDDYHVSCWIDADDEEMQRIQQAERVDYRLLTDRIREHLRTCRCLIFAYSTKSRASRWMPWELGFFDGRWGKRLIGLYDLDEGAGAKPAPQPGDEAGIPEFEQIYIELTPATLEGFLQYVRSPRALSDRADVDIDRWSNLVAGAMRDPVNVSVDAMQFWITYQSSWWSRALGIPGGSNQPLLDLTEVMRTALDPLARMMKPVWSGQFDALVEGQAAASRDAQETSRGGEAPRLGDFAPAFGLRPQQFPALDQIVRLIHDANADAVKYSR